MKQRVLFICIHNSARSQMAEAFLKQIAGDKFEVESAGIKSGQLNQNVIKVMKEIGLDISRNQTKSVFDLYTQGKQFEYVIAVCDPEAAAMCPTFPGLKKQLHWPLKDPSKLVDLEGTREIRDLIKAKVYEFAKTGG